MTRAGRPWKWRTERVDTWIESAPLKKMLGDTEESLKRAIATNNIPAMLLANQLGSVLFVLAKLIRRYSARGMDPTLEVEEVLKQIEEDRKTILVRFFEAWKLTRNRFLGLRKEMKALDAEVWARTLGAGISAMDKRIAEIQHRYLKEANLPGRCFVCGEYIRNPSRCTNAPKWLEESEYFEDLKKRAANEGGWLVCGECEAERSLGFGTPHPGGFSSSDGFDSGA